MKYYALQVQTSGEADFLKRVSKLVKDEDYHFFYPKRALDTRRKGRKSVAKVPVFSGYVFLACQEDPSPICYIVKKTPGFYRFLPDNNTIKPLVDRDLSLLKKFMSFGEMADKSKVSFDINDRIVVHSGPLTGYEASIVKVDRRKQRVKLRLNFCENPMLIDLGYELIEKLPIGAAKDGRDKPEQDLHNRGGLCRDDASQGDKP